MTRARALAVLALAFCCGGPESRPPLEIRHAWARPADSAGVTAAYLAIHNRAPSPIILVSITSDDAESVSAHRTVHMDGMVHMAPVPETMEIPPRDSLVFAEGARHVMVDGLRRRLAPGDSLRLAFHFKDGRVLRAGAEIRAP